MDLKKCTFYAVRDCPYMTSLFGGMGGPAYLVIQKWPQSTSTVGHFFWGNGGGKPKSDQKWRGELPI